MNRPVARILCALALVAGLAAPSARAQPGPELWMAYGDSLTAAVYYKSSWTQILERATGNRVVDAGRIVADSRDAVTRLDRAVLSRRPDLVFVMLGIHDQRIPDGGAPDGYRVPPEEFAANLDTVVTRIQATGARVVLLTSRPLVQGPGAPEMELYLDRHGGEGGRLYTLPGKTKDSIRLYNDIIRGKAREHGTGLVDIWQVVVDLAGGDGDADLLGLGIDRPPPELDGVHLGPYGVQLYAATILEAVPLR